MKINTLLATILLMIFSFSSHIENGRLLPGYMSAIAGAEKVSICHIPPENPSNAHTLSIAPAAVDAHMDHGDYTGECVTPEESGAETASETPSTAAVPGCLCPVGITSCTCVDGTPAPQVPEPLQHG